ncbi:PatB family C-S lyase [Sulfurimonas paralvinellae]|uniref:cysteine-S-conjugate beta-lyase n=1 Tax=Sulfurimonas paralvinellae TaxID=317658 RepID=A0A7M1BBL4_9BACT|nr:PatB family C-S lyase [Sulfurimonas paralvinellae]QOP46208.1 putative C-S lyase [Sulfurimonas paralvinellae]
MEKKIMFSTAASREGSNAEKYTLREQLFGTQDVLPVWVADMDINTPAFVLDAVAKRLQHPIIGYEEVPESAYLAQIAWMKEHHNVTFSLEDMFHSHSVVASMAVAIEAFSDEGDGIVVQTPVYPPFFQTVKRLKRRVVTNPLLLGEDGSYGFDIKDFKKKIDKDTKMLLLCSPHNPVGRVWREEELREIADICYENNIIVFADEIHCDLVFERNRHIPFASLGAYAREMSLTAIGVGKTFNMAGFAMSSVAVPDKELRERFREAHERVHFAQGAVLSHVAFETAYKEGALWLSELKNHLCENYNVLVSLAQRYEKLIRVTPLEGTYLAWLDCRGMGLGDRALREWFVKEANLGLNPGIAFGREGSGFMRLNFAVPSDTMVEIITRMEGALKRYDKN